jgi:hypothetical protein
MLDTLGTILFFVVFVQLTIVLSIYMWKTVYDWFKGNKNT